MFLEGFSALSASLREIFLTINQDHVPNHVSAF